MKMRIRDEAAGARGGLYIYVNPEDGHRIQHGNVGHTIRMAREYRRLNNYPIGIAWDDDVVQNICQNTPPPSCVEDGPPSIAARAVNLAGSLASWAVQGFSVRSKEEAERIWDICKSCEHYSGSRSVFKIACKRCGCSSVKVALNGTKCIIGKW